MLLIKNRLNGFTLVELIVVITILAILGTIAFMAFIGYSKNSRDSVRATDLSLINTSLELFQMKTGFLPDPSGVVPMTYSGGSMIVWNQGTFGDSVMQNVEKLSKKPVDPLFGTEYTYSITNGKNEFEVGGVVEGYSQTSGNFLLNQANAQNVIQQALIQGNYNGKVLKVENNGILYIFALPSIITSDLSTADVETLVLNKLLSYNGYGTIPASFSGTTTSIADSFDFGGVGTNIVVFSGSLEDLQNIDTLKTFTINLQEAYSGSSLIYERNYTNLMSINPESDDLINSEIAYLINNNLGGNITASSVDLGEEPPPALPCGGYCPDNVSSYYAWSKIGGGGCSGTDVVIGTGSNNVQCWMSVNVNIGTKKDVSGTQTFPGMGVGEKVCYGNLESNCTTYGGQYEQDKIMNGSASSNTIPSGVTGICPAGYHLPSDAEFQLLETSLGCTDYTNTGFICDGLGWVASKYDGFINGIGGVYTHSDFVFAYSPGLRGYFATSTEASPNLYYARGLSNIWSSIHRTGIASTVEGSIGLHVRCLKN